MSDRTDTKRSAAVLVALAGLPSELCLQAERRHEPQ